MASFYKPAEELKCQYCLKIKSISSFYMTWQRRHKVCNYCKDHYGQLGAVTKPKISLITKPCLRCGVDFKTVKEIRICSSCKESSSFSEDKFIDYVSQAVGLAL